jgi:S1-C subfamily serine protease
MADMRDSGYHWSGDNDQARQGDPHQPQPGEWGHSAEHEPVQGPGGPGAHASPSAWSAGSHTWQGPDRGAQPGWDHGQTARGPAWGAPANPYDTPGAHQPEVPHTGHDPYQRADQYQRVDQHGGYRPQGNGPYGPVTAPSSNAPFGSPGTANAHDHNGGAPYPGSQWGPGAPDNAPGAKSKAGQRRPKHLYAASLLTTALVAGGLGAGIALAVNGNNNNSANNASATSAPPVSGTTGGAGSNGSTRPGLNSGSAGNSGGASGNLGVAAIANRVEPAVVDIYASGPQGQDEGTGMIISSSGRVLTNNHVIAGSTQLQAQINGAGKKYPVTVVGADPTDDVAVLQLHGRSNFDTVQIGNSDNVSVGTQVVAIGNALGLAGPETVTNGIISATSRSISVSDPSTGATENLKGVFQTSAPINPGNSGGPLLDSNAQVIGINTAAASSSAGNAAASNVGFAIPINRAMSIVNQINSGKASSTIYIGQRAIIGIDVTTVTCAEGQANGCPGLGANPFSPFGYTPYQAPVNSGAVVAQIEAGTPAANAGLGVGDVIVSVDGQRVTTIDELTHLLTGKKAGQSVKLGWVDTSGAHHSANVKLIPGPNV